MYKYEKLAGMICKYFDDCRNNGKEEITISALDIEKLFDVSLSCGAAKRNSRFPLICQAMHNVPHYDGTPHEGPDPSSTFTVTYSLKKRRLLK